MKLGPQTHLGAKSQSEGTIQLVPKPQKIYYFKTTFICLRSIAGVPFDLVWRFRATLLLRTTCMRRLWGTWVANCVAVIQTKNQKPKMVVIIPRRRRGTWEGVPVANWCSEWICRMWWGLGPHILTIPASFSLSPMWGTATVRAPNDSFNTRISNFVNSPILSAARPLLF